jgi:hypothetical protein
MESVLRAGLLIYIILEISNVPVYSNQTRLHEEFDGLDLSEASVVVLSEEEYMRIEDAGEAYWEYKIKKKILKPNQPDEGFFSFPENKFREIISIKAWAIYPDGEKEELDEEDIKRVPVVSDFVFYSDSWIRAFRFEGIKPGTVIEVHVRYRIRNLIYWPPVTFQNEYPMLRKSYRLVYPEEVKIGIHSMNMDTLSHETVVDTFEGKHRLVWEARDIPPFQAV